MAIAATTARVGMHGPSKAVAVCGLVLLWGAGCVSFPVGKTGEFRHDFPRMESRGGVGRRMPDRLVPEQATLERARVALRERDGTAEVSVDADVIEECTQRRPVRQVTVRLQKRLAFGLFPGAAELVWMPEGALGSAMGVVRAAYDSSPRYCGYYVDSDPGLGGFALWQFVECLATFGTSPFLCTADSLLFWPFESWHCDSHDFIDWEYWKRGVPHGKGHVADASASPRLRALSELPEELRREIGVRTCFDVRSTASGAGKHYGLVGFHKYQAVFVEIGDTEVEVGKETRRRKEPVMGPFEVELDIPGVGYAERRLVLPGEISAFFELPAAPSVETIEARVRIREVRSAGNGEIPELTRAAIRDLMGQGSRFEVNLRSGRPGEEEKRAEYEVLEMRTTGQGRYVIRVRVANPGERDGVAGAVAAEVRRRIREDYANRHPSVRASEICDMLQGREDSGDPAGLVFEGWAFAAHPLSGGWQYDPETRRGEVRIAVSEGIPEEQALQWAQENIAAIVGDKAIALSTGVDPPPGGQFRCLWKRFENGILALGFENAD